MGDTETARYTFLPWLRQGVSAEITERDTLGQNPANPGNMAMQRANLSAALGLRAIQRDDTVQNYQVSRTVQLVGPGDVAGIHLNALVRTEPSDGTTNFKANCFPYIEFYEEDFLWRYSPAAPSGAQDGRLRPWVILLVLKEDEFTYKNNVQGLPYISINPVKAQVVLFPHTQSWAWAHVHFSQALAQTPGSQEWVQEIEQLLRKNPDAAVARLICPRKLQPDTSYQAFLVPAFETGRLAGLQEDASSVLAQMPSWQSGQVDPARLRFPVYYQWRFKTSEQGDFKSLAMQLKAKHFGPEFGQRAMDITNPGLGIDGKDLESETLGLEGSLAPVKFQSEQWPKGPKDLAYQNRLKEMVNLPANLQDSKYNQNLLPPHPFYNAALPDDPIITPPLYGQHYASTAKAGEPGNPAWLDRLNLHPGYRAAAGLGAQVIQQHQDELMEAAWKQIGEVNAANQKIREAELAVMVNQSLLEKRIQRMDKNKLLQVTAPMHKRILDQGATVHNTILSSRIPIAAKSTAIRKTLRPGRTFIKTMNAAGAGSGIRIQDNLIEHLNLPQDHQKAITAAVPKSAPNMALKIDRVLEAAEIAVQRFQEDGSLAQHAFLDVLAELQLATLDSAALKQALAARISGSAALNLANELVDGIKQYAKNANGIITVTLEAAVFQKFYGKDDTGKVKDNVLIQRTLEKNEKTRITSTTTLAEVQAYNQNLQDFAVEFKNKGPAQELPELDLSRFSELVHTRLNPELTLTSRLAATLSLWSDGSKEYVPMNVLQQVMAHPKFPQPVFEYLRSLSQDFIIPNSDTIPQNSLTLLKPNTAFIEAFMVGLNHEMGRELLWREYPTDQRGTYFEKFWDTNDSVGTDKRDISQIHLWLKDLGEHSLRENNILVMVIRGDLLRRYPNTMVYAQKAQWEQPGIRRGLCREDDVADTQYFRFPCIRAQLEPDIGIYGFVLTVEEALGTAEDPGWFFIMKERPGQIQFGLDDTHSLNPVENLNQLSWANFSSSAGDVNFVDLSQVNVAPGVQAEWQNANAADLATYMLRKPVLFARHAREMLTNLNVRG